VAATDARIVRVECFPHEPRVARIPRPCHAATAQTRVAARTAAPARRWHLPVSRSPAREISDGTIVIFVLSLAPTERPTPHAGRAGAQEESIVERKPIFASGNWMHEQPMRQQEDQPHQSLHVRQGLHLHFEPTTGIAGDMTVAALVDAGVPQQVVLDAVRAMNVPGLAVRLDRETTAARGLRYTVAWPSCHAQPHGNSHRHAEVSARHGHPHRSYAEIVRMLHASDLPVDTRHLAEMMFARLAGVEGRIHGRPVEDVTFHEVGAFDSIADIVGVAAAVAWLAPSSFSALPPLLGSGTIECAHGTIPVPAPATASLLAGYPAVEGGDGELTTPTGALVLTSLVAEFGAPPPMRIVASEYGIGTKTLHGRTSALRVMLGETTHADSPRAEPC
jgi:hypothetical protein